MTSPRSRTRSRLGFSALTLLLFVGSFAGAYTVRQRQNKTVVIAVDTTAVPDTTAVADTTTPLVVDSSVVETTQAVVETTAVPETTAPPAPTTAAPKLDLSLTTDGANFESSSERRLWDDTTGCDSISLRSGASKDCDRLTIANVGIAWVFDGEGGASILSSDPASDEAGTWNARLDTASSPSRRPLVTDVTGDDQKELVFGFRTETGLSVDVIEVRNGLPSVALHLNLVGGRVTAGDGQIDVWQQTGDSFEHWTLTRSGGRWTKDGFERTSSAPAGNL